MLTINYFASVREALGCASETLTLPEKVNDVSALVEYLTQQRDARWAMLTNTSQVLVAVNQTIVGREQALQDSDEVAFFPPMTGG